MPFAQQGAATGAGFGAQGMDTAFRFFTDPNFDFQKEGQAYQSSGSATGNAFGGLSQGMLPQQQAAAAVAAPEAAAAPAEKVEAAAAAAPAAEGAKSRDMFGPLECFGNSDECAKRVQSHPADLVGGHTNAVIGASVLGAVVGGGPIGAGAAGLLTNTVLPGDEDAEPAHEDHAKGYGKGHGGYRPYNYRYGGGAPAKGYGGYRQHNYGYGGDFGGQGMDTAFRFFTDPNFDFQKEGQAYQASGAA